MSECSRPLFSADFVYELRAVHVNRQFLLFIADSKSIGDDFALVHDALL